MAQEEKRKFTRVPFDIHVRIVSADTVVKSRQVRNVSLGGMFVYTTDPLAVGAGCVVDIDVVGPQAGLHVEAEADIIRVDGDGMALQFTDMDVESLTNLRRIVRVYSADPKIVDEEYFKELLEL